MVIGIVEGIVLNSDRNQRSSSPNGCLYSGQEGLQSEEADAFIDEKKNQGQARNFLFHLEAVNKEPEGIGSSGQSNCHRKVRFVTKIGRSQKEEIILLFPDHLGQTLFIYWAGLQLPGQRSHNSPLGTAVKINPLRKFMTVLE
jgi:hypothetical protein